MPKNERTFLRRSRFLDAISSLLLVASFATDSYDGKTWQGYQFLAGSLCVRSAPRQSFTSLTAADLVAKSSTGPGDQRQAHRRRREAEVTVGGGARVPQHPRAAVPSIGPSEVEASRKTIASDTAIEAVCPPCSTTDIGLGLTAAQVDCEHVTSQSPIFPQGP